MHVLNEQESVRAAAAIRLALALSAAVEQIAGNHGEELPAVFTLDNAERLRLAQLADRLSPTATAPVTLGADWYESFERPS